MKKIVTACLFAMSLGPFASQATEDHQFFRIGTGAVAGTYFPIGGLIADLISRPFDSRPCDAGGSCGVDGMIAVVHSTFGSVYNANAVQKGQLESGFVQANIAADAYTGSGDFEKSGSYNKLRVIAALYDEHIHLVRSSQSSASSVEELSDKTISVDREGSGTRVDALRVLESHELDVESMDLLALPSGKIDAKALNGDVDAFFITAGFPTKTVQDLADQGVIDLIPISGPHADEMRRNYDGVYNKSSIPGGAYVGIKQTPTLSVRALWITSSDVDDDTVYAITKSLWHINGRKILNEGHEKARRINIDTALQGVPIPLHNGAMRYYQEIGLR